MAYEAECDLVLSLLEQDASKSPHHISEFIEIFKAKKLNLNNRQIMAIFVILYDRKHIQFHEEIQILSENDKTMSKGVISITSPGSAFINTSSYSQIKDNEQFQTEIAKSNLLMVEFAKKQYIANLFIAVGTCMVGIYTLFQLFDYYEKHFAKLQNAAYFLSGFGLALLIWLIILQLKKTL